MTNADLRSDDASAPGLSALDIERLDMALAFAAEAVGRSDPNPRVGCVLGRADGTVIGTGSTQRAGSEHAEALTLRQARADGAELRGATAWVSLEPCAHQGRTPPCCDALIEAGIARVVVAENDPNPLVAGTGLARLRAAGVVVARGQPRHALATRELNIGFFSRHERGRPWVRMKIAASLDGRTALPDGRSQWITGEAARADGHAWRRRAGAVLTGIGTVLTDDPRLDVRLVPTHLQPLRVIVDSALRLPTRARLLQPPGQVWVATASQDAARSVVLHEAGAELQVLPDATGRVDLQRLIAELHNHGIHELHVEAGAGLNGSLLACGLVDELLVYFAPVLMGPGLAMANLQPLQSLSVAPRFDLLEVTQLGTDLRLRLRPATGSRHSVPRRES